MLSCNTIVINAEKVVIVLRCPAGYAYVTRYLDGLVIASGFIPEQTPDKLDKTWYKAGSSGRGIIQAQTE
ncbi:hypothetical protein [Salibacterium halotolerans]|uniref:hypothetical protein n=1 Tax=Salibacterium halotolerans TaxID=1884432 RepID=UPI0011138B12|nr:hypothetical protein [Salibacterium halotolerans]